MYFYLLLLFILIYCNVLTKSLIKIPCLYDIHINATNPYNFFFSIMIPVYNKLIYLNRSFTSLLCQNFSNFEIVIVDDCSTDGSYEFMSNIFFPQSITIIKHSRNLGTLNSRIDAIVASKGRYLLSLDPDDKLIYDLLNVVHSYLLYQHYDILEFQYYTYLKSGKKYLSLYPNSTNRFFLMNKTSLFNIRWPWNWSLWRKCFSRKLLLTGISYIPQNLLRIHLSGPEDLVIFYYTIPFCDKYLIINYIGYIYFQEQKGSAGVCGYFSCSKKRKMEKLAMMYSQNFLNQRLALMNLSTIF